MSLTCKIEVNPGFIKDNIITINWESPNEQCTSNRIECDPENDIKRITGEDGSVKTYVISRCALHHCFCELLSLCNFRTLRINELNAFDNGTYTCQASSNKGAKSGNTKETLRIVGPEDLFIGSFLFQGHQVITQPQSEKDTRWHFTIDVHPIDHATFTWRGPKGDIIDDLNLVRYEKNIIGDKVNLVIKDVSIDDMGPYPFEIAVETNQGSINRTEVLALIVNEEPKIEIEFGKNPILPFFAYGKDYDLSCNIKGYPIDTNSLEFYFYPCDDYSTCYPNQKKLFNSSLVPIDGVKDSKYHFNFSTSSLITAKENAKVGCDVCVRNNPKCFKKEEFMFINEHESGFEISGIKRGQELVEGDTIVLKCEASKFKYSSVVWIFKGPPVKHEYLLSEQEQIETSEKKLNSSSSNTKFSLVATIAFESLSKKDRGKYICEATKLKNNLTDRKSKIVKVFEIEPPKVKATNLNGTILNILAEEEFTFICDVAGRPEPTIQWFKDNHHVNETNFIEDNGKFLVLKYARGKDSGEYCCVAENRGGELKLAVTLSVSGDPTFNVGAVIGGSSAAGVVLIIVILIMLWKIREYNAKIRSLTAAELKLFEHGDPSSINEQLDVHEQTDLLPYNKYEFEVVSQLLQQVFSGTMNSLESISS